MKIFFRAPSFIGLCLLTAFVSQSPSSFAADTPGVNLIPNGNFDSFKPVPNLWNGVDPSGFLAGFTGNASALAKSGGIENIPMPVSVCMADLNGDGLQDLIVMDVGGYLRVYFNSGTKTEPKFSRSEVVPFFLNRTKTTNDNNGNNWKEERMRHVQRINLFDWNHRGMVDLLIGDYAGQIFLFPNEGSASVPVFRQPESIESGLIPTASGGVLWGTIFTPIAYEWEKKGKPDLLIGEGSYSANAVHLSLNQGNGSKPEFPEEGRKYLAYGDGREQLSPTVADYNGDGKPDLLVADREGTVGAYLNSGNWKPGVELKFASLLNFGGTNALGGPITIYAVDYNGDGLFDLIIGKNNGRIAVALNRGTKEQPKFDAPVEIKGDPEAGKVLLNTPDAWSCDTGGGKGNAYSYVTVVGNEDKDAAIPNNGHALKAGYTPCPNKIFKQPDLNIQGLDLDASTTAPVLQEVGPPSNSLRVAGAGERDFWTETKMFVVHVSPQTQLKVGGEYTLSFNVKGKGIKHGAWIFAYGGHGEFAPANLKKGERGSVIAASQNHTNEINTETDGHFSDGSSWSTVSKTFTVRFKDQRLNKLITNTTVSVLELSFVLPTYDSVCYISNVQLVEKK